MLNADFCATIQHRWRHLFRLQIIAKQREIKCHQVVITPDWQTNLNGVNDGGWAASRKAGRQALQSIAVCLWFNCTLFLSIDLNGVHRLNEKRTGIHFGGLRMKNSTTTTIPIVCWRTKFPKVVCSALYEANYILFGHVRIN